MNIRPENTKDHDAIQKVTYNAFENHPHHEVGSKPTEHLIVNKLRKSGALSVSLVAHEGSNIIGHIAFSPVTIAEEQCNWFGLGPVSVITERQGEGIGGQLINAGLEKLKELGAQGVVLLGEPEYYGRFGFKAEAGLILPDIPPEFFLALSLNEVTLLPSGIVSYHHSFT